MRFYCIIINNPTWQHLNAKETVNSINSTSRKLNALLLYHYINTLAPLLKPHEKNLSKLCHQNHLSLSLSFLWLRFSLRFLGWVRIRSKGFLYLILIGKVVVFLIDLSAWVLYLIQISCFRLVFILDFYLFCFESWVSEKKGGFRRNI